MQQATRVDGINKPILVPNLPKKVAPGFNYSRAVQGACPGPGADPSDCYNDKGVVSGNRFSVLDTLNSIKFNNLITGQVDLYLPDQGLGDNMEVEVNPLNSNGFYGITDAQKQVILNCMCDFKYVQAEAVEEWSQGEWDFFADKCLELGLDPENSILYPEEDTETVEVEDIEGFDSGHAASHLKKLGVYVDPVVSKASNHDDGEQFDGFVLFSEKAEEFERFAGHWQPDWGLFFRFNLAQKDYFGFRLAGGPADLVFLSSPKPSPPSLPILGSRPLLSGILWAVNHTHRIKERILLAGGMRRGYAWWFREGGGVLADGSLPWGFGWDDFFDSLMASSFSFPSASFDNEDGIYAY
ncbi:hypothetical protein L1987_45390 [Smallanthus sonchifolius]|uniref:Uncharacterized protein n=1 Tax=Smallanthus sonchifolius TaxID=185202 RepID=A0ACB9GRY6_9ASTR|nr:hypothetical protein L1987_45390 [Smallanthus sonchifolius]